MKANFVFFRESLKPGGRSLQDYIYFLEELLAIRTLGKKHGDSFYKPGDYSSLILNEIVALLPEDSKERIKVLQLLRFLLDHKLSFPIYGNPDTIDDVVGLIGEDNNCFIVDHSLANPPAPNISDQMGWYTYHRQLFINHPPQPEQFCNELSPYFPNLYFHPDIPNYFDGLHCKSPIPIIRTLIHHLTALNDRFFEIYTSLRQEGVPNNCKKLQAEMDKKPIAFGCSVDGQNHTLNFNFVDKNVNKEIYCDPHTKLWEYFENVNGDQGDRIYFSQPIDGFLNEKVLIARIGEHIK